MRTELAEPDVPVDQRLPPEMLHKICDDCGLRALGRISRVCSTWKESLTSNHMWQHTACRLGYYGYGDQPSRHAPTDWKPFVARERARELKWLAAGGAGLRCRSISTQGHQHWVPTVLAEERSGDLVTCSYDGTIRFWQEPVPGRSECFRVLRAGVNEGFTCIAALPPAEADLGGAGGTLLAAGSEWGRVHVWECWRPEDEADAERCRGELGRRPPHEGWSPSLTEIPLAEGAAPSAAQQAAAQAAAQVWPPCNHPVATLQPPCNHPVTPHVTTTRAGGAAGSNGTGGCGARDTAPCDVAAARAACRSARRSGGGGGGGG